MGYRTDRSYTEETEYEQSRRRRGMSPKTLLVMLALILAIVIVLARTYYLKTTLFTSYAVNSTRAVTDGSRYLGYGKGYVFYTTEGAEAVNGDSVIWNISYDMKKPIADCCGDYCVFADKGGQSLCITDGTGANYKIEVTGKIVDVCIASQGVVAVWTDTVTTDHIFLYDINGNKLLDIETSISADGFPLSIDLSDDGTKMVTSYMKVGDELTSWVTFYNFGDVGQNFSDRVVGSFSFKGELIPSVRFINDDRVAVLMEKKCILYRMKEIPEELAVQDAPRLSAVCNNSEYICLAENETDGTTALTVFDSNGKLKKKIITGITYTGMYLANEELIIYNNSSCIIYNLDGSEKFRAQIDGGIRNIFPGGKNKYYIINPAEINQIVLKTEK